MPKKKVQKSILDLIDYADATPPKKVVGGYRRRFTKYDENLDFEETPAIATEALLSVEKFTGNILEPAAGKGAISKILMAHGYDVTSMDKVNRLGEEYDVKKKRKGKDEFELQVQKDFLAETGIWDNVVTNFPFKIAGGLIYHACHHVRNKVAVLLRGTYLEGRGRHDYLFENPNLPLRFARVHVFIDRLPFGEANMVMYAWFIWDKDFKGQHPEIHWL